MQFSLLVIDGLWFSRACSASVEGLSVLERKFTGAPQCELHEEANWGTSFSPVCVRILAHRTESSFPRLSWRMPFSCHWHESSLPELCAVRCAWDGFSGIFKWREMSWIFQLQRPLNWMLSDISILQKQ